MSRDTQDLDLTVLRSLLAAALAVPAIAGATLAPVVGGAVGALLLTVPVACAVVVGFRLGAWPSAVFVVLTGLVGPGLMAGLVAGPGVPAAELIRWVALPVLVGSAGVGLLARAVWTVWSDRRSLVVAGMIVAVLAMALLPMATLLGDRQDPATTEVAGTPVESTLEREGDVECGRESVMRVVWDQQAARTPWEAAETMARTPPMQRAAGDEDLTVEQPQRLSAEAREYPVRLADGALVALFRVGRTEDGGYAVTEVTLCD